MSPLPLPLPSGVGRPPAGRETLRAGAAEALDFREVAGWESVGWASIGSGQQTLWELGVMGRLLAGLTGILRLL